MHTTNSSQNFIVRRIYLFLFKLINSLIIHECLFTHVIQIFRNIVYKTRKSVTYVILITLLLYFEQNINCLKLYIVSLISKPMYLSYQKGFAVFSGLFMGCNHKDNSSNLDVDFSIQNNLELTFFIYYF